jgi:methionyl-tRNA formyltransferase
VTSSSAIVFAGTPDFSVPALDALVASGHHIAAVYTQPDRPAGRGQKLTMSAVKEAALRHGLHVEQPATLRSTDHIEQLRSFKPDLMVVVAYGLILPQAVLDIPRLGCVNIHASLLPRWRGAAPIHRAIQAGDEQTGITIMRMEAGLDTGPMLLEVREPIHPDDTTASLHDRLATRGAEALLAALPGIVGGSLEARAQPSDGVTYAAKIAKEEARIDWFRPAVEIDRQVRAFNPWPVAQTTLNGVQLRVWNATPASLTNNASPGTITGADEHGIHVATGNGVLSLTRVQLAGRKPTQADEFIRGQALNLALERVVLGT